MKLDYTITDDEATFKAAIDESSRQHLLVIDTEYEKEPQYGKANILGVSWGYPLGSMFKAYYAPFRHRDYPGTKNLQLHLFDEFNRFPAEGTQVYHNWPADHGVFLKEGIDFSERTIFDTMVATHLGQENHRSYSLDYLANIKFKVRKTNLTDLEKQLDAIYDGQGWAHIPPMIMGRYACTDVFLTYMLYRDATVELQRQGLEDLYSDYEEFIKALYKVTSRGLYIDEKLARELQNEGRTEMQSLLDRYEFNLGSSQKVADYLHNFLMIPVRFRTAKGAPATDSLHLRRYRDRFPESSEFVEDVLKYRGLSKAVSTWYEGFLTKRGVDGLLHPGLTIAGAENGEGGTKTGRLSCRQPNLQQVPRATSKSSKVRSLFLDPPGYRLVELDYSQAELRLTGYYMEQKGNSMVADAYRNETDIHAITAENMGLMAHTSFKEARQVGKTCNFSLCYRAGPSQLRHILYRDANLDVTEQQAATWHKAWHNTYPEVRLLNELAESTAKRKGYVRMWNGRRRHLTGNDCFKAYNSIIQGGVGQIMVYAMIEINKQFPDVQVVNQVHDSVWLYLPEDEVETIVSKIVPVMESIPTQQFGIPFVVDWKYWNGY